MDAKSNKPTTYKLGGITGKGFMPGQSGNPNGHRKGVVNLAAHIRRHTRDGRDLVEFLVGIVNDDGQKADDRIKAIGILLDRGWGRPDASITLSSDGKPLLVVGNANGSTPTAPYP